MEEAVVTGLRIAATILWAWFGMRLLLGDDGSPELRDRPVWQRFRTGYLVMAFVVVFLFSPENILRANHYIDETTGFYMLMGGIAGLIVSGIYNHLALDVGLGPRFSMLPSYVGITALSVAYVAGAA